MLKCTCISVINHPGNIHTCGTPSKKKNENKIKATNDNNKTNNKNTKKRILIIANTFPAVRKTKMLVNC